MRKYTALVAFISTVWLASPGLAAPSPEDIGAAAVAKRAFLEHRQTCSAKIISAVDVTPPQMNGFTNVPGYKPLKPYTIINEAADLEQQIDGPGARLTTADRLNGIQWKGRVHMVARAAREISVSRDGKIISAWGPWRSNVTLAIVDLQLRNGSWQIAVNEFSFTSLGRAGQLRRASCAEVPA